MLAKNSPNYCKHLTPEERHEIQMCLDCGMTFKAIANRIGKDPTTVSKEVKKHLQTKPVASNRSQPTETCPKLLRAPFVCNPCQKKPYSCAYQKQFYYAPPAQAAYKTLLSEAREGIPLNKEVFYRNAEIIQTGLKKGQHLYHILQTHPLDVAQSTIYRHVKRGYVASPIDLPRMVKFKPRRKKYTIPIPKKLKIGRTFSDFQAYLSESDLSAWVKMDTVIGAEGGKVLMTFTFTSCNFMFGMLLENKTAAETAGKIRTLKARLSAAGVSFGSVFPVLLTDNGGEFADVFAFENDVCENRETRLFFCDPMQSSQKPQVEKNHTLLRDIVPKGSSFDRFTQDTANLIFSHINGVKRQSLHGKSAYEVFTFLYSEHLASLLGISCIPPEHVNQSPRLLKN